MTVLWSVGLAIVELGVIDYHPLEWQTFLIFAGTVAVFAAGCFLARTFAYGEPADSTDIPEHLPRQLMLTMLVTFALSMIGNIWYYREMNTLIGIQSLWEDPRLVRYAESIGELRRAGTFTVAFLRIFTLPTFIFGAMYIVIAEGPNKLIAWIVCTIALCAEVLASGRTGLFTLVGWGLCATTYLRLTLRKPRKHGWQRTLAVTLLFIVAVWYFQFTSARYSKALEETPEDVSIVHLPDFLSPAGGLLIYLTGGFPAFQQMASNPSVYAENGNLTFGFASRILFQIAPYSFRYPEYVQPFANVPSAVNVYTYLDAYFLDFGYAGMFLFPLLMGFICSALYFRSLPQLRPFLTYVAALYACYCLDTTLTNRFGTLETFLYLVLNWPIYVVCGRVARI